MNKVKKFVILVLFCLITAAIIGVGSNTWRGMSVERGFVFGPPNAQQKMETPGMYKIQRWGYPATYREIQVFRADGNNPYELSYEYYPFNFALLLSNVIVLTSFFIVVLAPVIIFWMARKKRSEAELADDKNEQQVGANADSRD